MHIIIEHFLMNDSLVDDSLEYRKLLEMLTMGDANISKVDLEFRKGPQEIYYVVSWECTNCKYQKI